MSRACRAAAQSAGSAGSPIPAMARAAIAGSISPAVANGRQQQRQQSHTLLLVPRYYAAFPHLPREDSTCYAPGIHRALQLAFWCSVQHCWAHADSGCRRAVPNSLFGVTVQPPLCKPLKLISFPQPATPSPPRLQVCGSSRPPVCCCRCISSKLLCG